MKKTKKVDFFELNEKKQVKILDKVVKESNKMQADIVKRYNKLCESKNS